MKLSNHSAIPVYTISGSSTARPLPEWLARKRKRSLKQDPEYANRIELLQDFEFEEASSCIQVSEDGDWIVSTGTYKPQIHVHYLPHLSLSFARHTNALNIKFLLLSSDYSKSLHLQSDRYLEFHNPSGCHYSTRIPRYGRDLIYDRRAAEGLVTSAGVNSEGMGEVFRINLELGRFMRSYEVEVGGDDLTTPGGGALQGGVHTGSVNAAAIAEDTHNLLAFGTSLGTVELWDPRSRSRAGILSAPPTIDDFEGRAEISSLQFHRSGLTLATGSSTGLVHLYDLRSPIPLLKKDQGYGYPIQNIIFLNASRTSSGTAHLDSDPKILTADKRIIKIWNSRDGSPWTAVEPAVDLNSVVWCKDSGMILTANEGRQQHSFFIPQLGPAPKWCSFLDNLVEEMAEDPNDPSAFKAQKTGDVYDNYKFLTSTQLETLNLDHLVGTTNMLKPYMHGFFVAQQLYDEARLISNPDLWLEQREKTIRDKIAKERESRIRGSKKAPTVKVNRRLAERMLEREEKNERRKAQRALAKDQATENDENGTSAAPKPPTESTTTPRPDLLTDNRFAELFQDEDFLVDETSREFQSLNPSTRPRRTSDASSTASHDANARRQRLTAAEQEEADIAAALSQRRGLNSDSDSESDSDDDRQRNHRSAQSYNKSNSVSTASYKKSGHQRQDRTNKPRMHVSSSRDQPGNAQRVQNARDRSFSSRARDERSSGRGRSRNHEGRSRDGPVLGERQVTFSASRGGKAGRGRGGRGGFGASGGDDGGRQRNFKDRRSASGNTMREL